jgi:hypothetical protein
MRKLITVIALLGMTLVHTSNNPVKSGLPFKNQTIMYPNPQNASGEVGGASWGFTFVPPEGWVSQVTTDWILLGHNSIAGLIIIMPHQAQSIAQMQMEMKEGLQEEGTNLQLSGSINTLKENSLIGDYEGYLDGTVAKAKCIGVLSPNGGGAYIIAASTPEMYSESLVNAAKEVAGNMTFIKMGTTELVNHFAGKWTTFTTNTSTDIYLYPNGVYSEYYEASYSGGFEDGGTNTGNWGANNQSNDTGKWTVRGSIEKGTIIIDMQNGEQYTIEYQVHVENGQTYYGEYWFNGSLYSKTAL